MYVPDAIDWKIITLLNEDGRMPSAEIARRLGNVSDRTVTNRINTLLKHGIINVRAIVDPGKVGFGVMADVFLEVEPGRVREVAYKVAEYPQISYVACATGESDVSISLRVRDIEELFDFVTEKLGKIPGVRRTQSYLLPLKVKDLDTWLPPDAYCDSKEKITEDS
jgi:Lrp/AsnC family transcriptional regulator for asnA, asnC and gidA